MVYTPNVSKTNASKGGDTMVNRRLHLIMSDDEFNRLTITEFDDGSVQVIVDVHGMKCYQARRFINNIINIAHCELQLVVIHGYNHGTAIKDMLAFDFNNSHVSEQHLDANNQGVTHMLIAA